MSEHDEDPVVDEIAVDVGRDYCETCGRYVPDGGCPACGADEPERCARLLVGLGDDTYDPNCALPRDHKGSCMPDA